MKTRKLKQSLRVRKNQEIEIRRTPDNESTRQYREMAIRERCGGGIRLVRKPLGDY